MSTNGKGAFAAAALCYLERGWWPIPIEPRGKRPLIKWKQYQDRAPTVEEINSWWDQWPNANVAILTGAQSGIVVVDIDSTEGERVMDTLVPGLVTPTSITARGRHLLFEHPGIVLGNRVKVDGVAIDIRGDGGYVVAPPSIHPTGVQYHWDQANGWGLECPLAHFPAAFLELLVSPTTGSGKPATKAAPTETSNNHEPFQLPETIPEGQRNDLLFRYGCSLRAHGASQDEILLALAAVNLERCQPVCPDSELAGISASASTYDPMAGRKAQTATAAAEHCTDLGNAQRLVRLHGAELRYVSEWKTWYVWSGQHWERDQTGAVVRRAKNTIRKMYADAQAMEDSGARKQLARWALTSESDSRIRAMIELSRTEPGIATRVDQLDRHAWLLNVGNGTIDLRTGQVGDHDPQNIITQLAPVTYDPAADAPRWNAFLQTVLRGDTRMIEFLQRLVGYSLTGDVSEQVLVFLHGYGANGKTTFLNAILDLLGTYARQGDPQLLMVRCNDGHPTGMADLKGSRFVVCSEVDEGRHLAEATVKQLTGGDRMKARLMHRDFFEFRPTHKIWLGANHKPVIKGTDYAIWRRIRLIPFSVTIPEDQRDGQLAAKLRAELPGILAWAVRGCLEWQKHGLMDPQQVTAATAEYRSEMDLLAQFVEERCLESPALAVPAKALYEAYRGWCESNGLHPSTKQSFGRRIEERGYGKVKTTGGQLEYRGVELK